DTVGIRSQSWLPLAELAVRTAAAEGRFETARSELLGALGDGLPAGKSRYVWPLLLHGTVAEADSRGLPALDAGRAAVLARGGADAGPEPADGGAGRADRLRVGAGSGSGCGCDAGTRRCGLPSDPA